MPVVLNILRNHVKMVLVFDGYCQMVVLAIGVAVLLLGWKKIQMVVKTFHVVIDYLWVAGFSIIIFFSK